MNNLNGISVIVCCFNSAGRLAPTLAHLAHQKISDFEVEIIVVDNNSSDDTSLVAKKLWSELGDPFSLNVVLEGNPGLMSARKKGVEVASKDIVVFCDDDNWLDAGYLSKVHVFFSGNPSVGVIGGEGKIKADLIPGWFNSFSRQYACFPQRNDFPLYGAGLSVRAGILKHIFGITEKFYLSGRLGGRLIGGDDHELFYLIKWTGYSSCYVPELKFDHFMPPERLTIPYLERIVKGAGYSSPMLWPYEREGNFYLFVSYRLLRLALGFAKILLYGVKKEYLLLRLRIHFIFCGEVVRSACGNWSRIRNIADTLKRTRTLYRIK